MSETNEMNDKPAEIWADGTQLWYKNGKQHHSEANEMSETNEMNNKPGEIWADGTQLWYKNGQPQCGGDKPAVITVDGTQCCYVNNVYIK